jgi:hypothetical protein
MVAMSQPETKYINLDVEIGDSQTALRIGPLGAGRVFRADHRFDEQAFGDLRDLRSAGTPLQYGKRLMEAAFPDPVRAGYYVADTERQNNGGRRLRLRLNLRPEAKSELHSLWWECLNAESPTQRRLGCSNVTPLSRYAELPASRHIGPVTERRLKVLVVVSNPKDLGQGRWKKYPKLHEERECEAIEQALQHLGDRVECHFQNKPANLPIIEDRLLRERFHILHILAHGAFSARAQKGGLILEDDDEMAVLITEDRLRWIAEDLEELRLVVLAVCQSAEGSPADPFIGLARRLVEMGVPAVVAMQDILEVDTARLFTERFYRSLGPPQPEAVGVVDVAVNDARRAIFTKLGAERWDWSVPVLFMGSDQPLFQPGGEQESAPTDLGGGGEGTLGGGILRFLQRFPGFTGAQAISAEPEPRERLYVVPESVLSGKLLVPEVEEAQVRLARAVAGGQAAATGAQLQPTAGWTLEGALAQGLKSTKVGMVAPGVWSRPGIHPVDVLRQTDRSLVGRAADA